MHMKSAVSIRTWPLTDKSQEGGWPGGGVERWGGGVLLLTRHLSDFHPLKAEKLHCVSEKKCGKKQNFPAFKRGRERGPCNVIS